MNDLSGIPTDLYWKLKYYKIITKLIHSTLILYGKNKIQLCKPCIIIGLDTNHAGNKRKSMKIKIKKRANNPQFIDVDLRPMDGVPWNSQRKKEVNSIQVNLEQNISLVLICSLTKQIIVCIMSEMIPCYLCKFEIPKLTEVLLLNQDQVPNNDDASYVA